MLVGLPHPPISSHQCPAFQRMQEPGEEPGKPLTVHEYFHLGTFLKHERNWFSFCLSLEVPGLSFSLPFSSRRPRHSFFSFRQVMCFRLLVQSSKFLCRNWCGKSWHWTLVQYQGSFYPDRSSLGSPGEQLSKKLPASLQIPSSTALKIAVRTFGWSQQACGIGGWKSVFFFHEKAEKFYNLGNMKWFIYVHTQLLLQIFSYKRRMFQAQIGVQRALKPDYALPMYDLYNTVYTYNFIFSSFDIK